VPDPELLALVARSCVVPVGGWWGEHRIWCCKVGVGGVKWSALGGQAPIVVR